MSSKDNKKVEYSASLVAALICAFATLGTQVFFHGSSIGAITFQILTIIFLIIGISENK